MTVFYPDGFDLSYTIDAETKNKISHRGKASKDFIEKFKKFDLKKHLSLYIHLPWCEKKCPYCDFNVTQTK